MAQWNTTTQSFNNKDSDIPGRRDFNSYVQADHYGELAPWHPEFTSKNRLKTSNSTTVFWSTFDRYPDTDVWATATVAGGTAYINNDAVDPTTFDPDNPAGNVILEKSVVLRVDTAGDKVVRQTKRIIPYFPGKAQQVSMAMNLSGHVANTRQRVGIFDENNGAYFECDGGEYFCVIRKNGVETVRVAQTNWNGDRLNGSGKTGINLNPTKQQLLAIEYEWYGAGAVQFGFVIDNELQTIHTVYNANVVNGTWSQTPNLPIRLELEALGGYAGGNAYLYQSSTAVTSEGSRQEGGVLNTAITGINFGTNPPTINMALNNMPLANTFYPIASIRLKSDSKASYVSPESFQLWNHSNAHMTYAIVKNPTTLTGATFAITDDDWVGAEIDQAANAVNFTADQIIFSGHITTSENTIAIPKDTLGQLGRKFTNPGAPDFADLTSDVITICAASMGANVSSYASITWTEQP